MKVSDIMRTEFLSFKADDKLEDIVKTFAKEHINSAPVFDGSDFIGIVSDVEIVKYFTPKKFLFLWKKDKPTPIEEVKKVTALDVVKNPAIVLKPDQDLSSVLIKIVHKVDCIPVMDKNKLVGLIRSDEIINFFLKELAKGQIRQLNEIEGALEEGMATEIDRILEIVNRQGKVSSAKISEELGISLKTVEKLCVSLSKHHLIEIDDSFFKGMIVKRHEYEKK